MDRNDLCAGEGAEASGRAVGRRAACRVAVVVAVVVSVFLLFGFVARPVAGGVVVAAFVALLRDFVGTTVGGFLVWQVLVPAVVVYVVVVWPVMRVFRQWQRCFVDGVYCCRSFPRRCFDCWFLYVVGLVVVPVGRLPLRVVRCLRRVLDR